MFTDRARPPRAARLGGILRLEDGGAGHEDRRAVLGERPRVLDLHAAVDRDVDAARAEHGADLSDLRIDGGNEFLAAEARVHRHHEHEIEVVLHPLDRGRRRRGIERRARLHRGPAPADELANRGERALQVRTHLHVHGQHVRAANSARYFSGSTIMRCRSSGSRVRLRIASRIGKPMVMFGTNRPSITSMWIWSAPAASTRAISSARTPKSADRIDGAILITAMSASLYHATHARRSRTAVNPSVPWRSGRVRR